MSVWDNPYISKRGRFSDSKGGLSTYFTTGRPTTKRYGSGDYIKNDWKLSGDAHRSGIGADYCPKCGRPKDKAHAFCGFCR